MRAARWSSATAWAPTWRRPPRPSWTPRSSAATAATTTSWTASSRSRWRSARRWRSCWSTLTGLTRRRRAHAAIAQRRHLLRLHPDQRARRRRHREARPLGRRQRLRRVGAAHLVQVRRADRRHEVRVAVAVERHRAAAAAARVAAAAAAPRAPRPRPRRRSAPARGASRARPPRRRPGCGACASRDTTIRTPRPRRYSISAARRSARWLPSPSSRPLQRAQLARARPPDSRAALTCAVPCPCKRADGGFLAPVRCGTVMCRVFGCVAAEPASIRHELVEAENPLIRQSEEHDSGWGMAVYERADGLDPRSSASPRPPTRTATSSSATEHARAASSTSTCAARRWAASPSRTPTRSASAATPSATTARSCATRACSSPASSAPEGDTDSEAFFNFLMAHYDASDPIGSLAPRHPHHRRALALQRPQLPLLGRRPPVRLPARPVRPALAAPARPAAGRLREGHRTSTGTPSSRTSCSCSTRTTSRSPTPSA